MKHVGKAVLFSAAGVVLCVYLFAQMTGPRGVPSLLNKWRNIESLQKTNATLETDIERLEAEIDRLKHDQEAQDVEIRRRLGKQHEGTIDFMIPEVQKDQEEEPSSSETTP